LTQVHAVGRDERRERQCRRETESERRRYRRGRRGELEVRREKRDRGSATGERAQREDRLERGDTAAGHHDPWGWGLGGHGPTVDPGGPPDIRADDAGCSVVVR
jgi:hypothetical protein